ncbi:MAG: glucosamine-6-phosphate deaminase [Bacteroidota bacterium]
MELKSFTKDNLIVEVYASANEMGESAAQRVAGKLAEAIKEKGSANLLIATGASQFAFYDALKKIEIEWNKITTFHLDEYLNMPETHPASFRRYLKERILNEVKPKQSYFLGGDAEDIEEELKRYEELLKNHPIDIGCIGIGENGHIAFNDPPVADFNDPKLVKVVELDDACRNQQYGEGWFETFDSVPTHALSMTVPAIMSCKVISCFVPDERKAEAVKNMLYGEISTNCPASILRNHENTILYIDEPAASRIRN